MSKKRLIVGLSGGLLVLAIAGPAAAWGVGLSVHSAADEKLCIDAKHDGKGAGTVVQLHTCNNTEAQRWAVARNTDNWGQIIGPGGLCLADKPSSKSAYLYGCTFADGQLWKQENGRLTQKSSGKCLTVANVATDEPLVLETCANVPKEVWKFKQE
ncbi:MAG TPA: RICIN domain-containing protein [Labilithrix sp.]|jgi:hypothetical protein